MAGITNASFLNKVIPFGFDVATLGGFNLDYPTIEACKLIIARGRSEFNIPQNEIFNHIKNEVSCIKNAHNVKVSVNLRSTSPDPIIKVSKISKLDIVEINCHCRQKELLDIGCGQNMLKRHDFKEFISEVVDNSHSKVSVKIRGNVPGVDTLEISKLIESCGVDYLHIDAMNPGVLDADFDLIKEISNETNIFIIGNNSLNNRNQIIKMLDSGASGFSIARALLNGKLDFRIDDL